jgi:hypothetical protein
LIEHLNKKHGEVSALNTQSREGLLSPYRVLDLTDDKGLICGKILGDLGADVIKIENPGGDKARSIGPFYNDIPDPEKSLFWFAYTTLATKKVTIYTEILLSCEYCVEQNLLPRAHLRGIFNRHGNH